jgi:hypothetical protein
MGLLKRTLAMLVLSISEIFPYRSQGGHLTQLELRVLCYSWHFCKDLLANILLTFFQKTIFN